MINLITHKTTSFFKNLNRINGKTFAESFIINGLICNNYKSLRIAIFFSPLVFLALILGYLATQNALNAQGYIEIQKEYFLTINNFLGQYPVLEANLTQLGDGLIGLSLLSILILYAPKIWESLFISLIISVIVTVLLKKSFKVPRPAAALTDQNFYIIGKKLEGFNSCPSGHSITVFIFVTTLMFAFMPKLFKYKLAWIAIMLVIGLKLIFTRVGVGAHYPLDTIIGGIIGYMIALGGMFISRRYNFCYWINKKMCYPLFITLFLIATYVIINKITQENLFIFYFALLCLIVSLYKITHVYVKK